MTVAEIARTTGLGRSTVAKALNRLAAAGHATRTPGTGSGTTRTPDRWNPTPPSTGTAADPTADPRTSTPPAEATTDTTTDEASVSATKKARKSHATSDSLAPGQDAPVPAKTTTTAARTTTGTAPTAAVTAAAAAPTSSGGAGDEVRNPVTGTVKLRSGALTQLVAGHFAAHPNTPLTAGEVGRALGRSGGAVRNACDKLVNDGDLRLASDHPRRYTLDNSAA